MAEMRGKTLTIEEIYNDCYQMKESVYWWTDEMLEEIEPVEGDKYETEENELDEVINLIKDTPEIMRELNKPFQKIQDENEKIKLENRNLQSRIDNLEGQISVYERYLDIKKEEK